MVSKVTFLCQIFPGFIFRGSAVIAFFSPYDSKLHEKRNELVKDRIFKAKVKVKFNKLLKSIHSQNPIFKFLPFKYNERLHFNLVENCGGFLTAGEVITDFMLTDDHNWTDKWSKTLVVC